MSADTESSDTESETVESFCSQQQEQGTPEDEGRRALLLALARRNGIFDLSPEQPLRELCKQILKTKAMNMEDIYKKLAAALYEMSEAELRDAESPPDRGTAPKLANSTANYMAWVLKDVISDEIEPQMEYHPDSEGYIVMKGEQFIVFNDNFEHRQPLLFDRSYPSSYPEEESAVDAFLQLREMTQRLVTKMTEMGYVATEMPENWWEWYIRTQSFKNGDHMDPKAAFQKIVRFLLTETDAKESLPEPTEELKTFAPHLLRLLGRAVVGVWLWTENDYFDADHGVDTSYAINAIYTDATGPAPIGAWRMQQDETSGVVSETTTNIELPDNRKKIVKWMGQHMQG